MLAKYKPTKVKYCPSPAYNNKMPLSGGKVIDTPDYLRINNDIWYPKAVGFTPTEWTDELKTQPVHGGRIVSVRTSLGAGTEYPFPPLVRENVEIKSILDASREELQKAADANPYVSPFEPVTEYQFNPGNTRDLARCDIMIKYAWITEWENDPKKRIYKSTLHNARVNMAAELAALDTSLNVTAEFKNLNVNA